MAISDGVNVSQNVRLDFSNTRMAISDGVDASQNVRLDYSNTAITIIQGVDTGQNNRMTISDGVNVSQNSRLDYSNTAITIIQGVDTSQNARMVIIEGTDVSQNARMTIIEGVDVTQNAATAATNQYATSAFSTANNAYTKANNALANATGTFAGTLTVTGNVIANSFITSGSSGNISGANFVYANTFVSSNAYIFPDGSIQTTAASTAAFSNGAYNQANTATVLAQAAYNQANVTIGVDASQNSRMTIIEGTDASQNVRLDYSNTAITIIQGVDTSQNSRMTIADGVDASQNSRLDYSNTALTIAQGVDNSQNVRIDYSNAAITIIQGTDTTQNTRLTVIEGTDASQNVRLDYSNTALTIAQGVDNSQNVRIDFSNTAITIIQGTDASQNVRLDYSNAVITIIQGVDVSQNARMTIIEGVDVTQNTNIANKLSLTGALNQTVSGNVTISSDLIVTGNLIITGNINSQNVQQLTVADPLIVLGVGNYVSDTKDIGFAAHYNDGTNAHAGLFRDSGTKEFYIFQGYTPEVDAVNNIIITDPTFRTANLNANFVKGNLIATTAVVGGLDVNSRLDYSNTAITIIQGVDSGQNSRMTIIEGVDSGQNARMTIIEGTDSSQNVRLDYSNTAITIIQGVDSGQNARMTIIEGTDSSQNARMVIIEGTDLSQNTRMTIIEGTDASQNVRLNFSNTRMDISDGVDASQNVRLDFSNTRMTIIDGVDSGQNSRMTIIEGTDVSQNARMTIIEGVDVTQNTNISTVTALAQAAFNRANTEPDAANYLANTIIVANSTGYLSNSNLFFTSSNNSVLISTNTWFGGTTAFSEFGNISRERFRIIPTLGGTTLNHGDNTPLTIQVDSKTALVFPYIAPLVVNYLQISGNTTGNAVTISTNGSDTNVNMNVVTKGSGSILFNTQNGQTGNGGSNTQFQITNTSNSVNYVQVTGSVTGSTPVISAQGPDATVALSIQPKGSFGYVNIGNQTNNYFQLYPNSGTGGPTFWTWGSDTDVPLNIATKGAGNINFKTNSGANNQFVIASTASAVNYIQVNGNATTGAPYFSAQGTDPNISLGYISKGIAGHIFSTGGTLTNLQFVINNTTSSVNYIQVTGAVTGGTPYFATAGSDASIGAVYATKGSGASSFWSQSGTALQFRISDTASAVNYLQVTGNTTGGGVVLSAQGSDTNVGINITPKGAGSVNVTSTTSSTSNTTGALVVSGGLGVGNTIWASSGFNNGIRTAFGQIYDDGNLHIHGLAGNLWLNATGGGSVAINNQYPGNVLLTNGTGNVQVLSTQTSTSNTTGALVVSGGLGLSGNLSMNLASSGAQVNRLTLSPLSYLQSYSSTGSIEVGGSGYWYFSGNGGIVNQSYLVQRATIYNDTGNTTVLFAGSSAVKIQNGTASSNTTTGALVVQGGVGISGALNATTKSFNIPHPTKIGKDLRYGSLEGPEFGVYVRGTLKGSDTIELPDYWTKLVDANTITVSLTPIGKYQKLSVKEVKDNTIIINSDGWFKKEIHCYYVVYGERADVDKLDVEG
jgi:hypothetical protein